MPQMVTKFVSGILSAAQTIMNNGNVITAMNVFLAFGASLLAVWFLISISQQASKDMLTLEKLITTFIKLFLAFCIMLYIPEISNGLFSLGIGLNNAAVDLDLTQSASNSITYFGYAPGQLPDWDDEGEDGEKIRKIFTNKGSSSSGAQSSYVPIEGATENEEEEDGLFPGGLRNTVASTLSAIGSIVTLLLPAGACLIATGLSFLVCLTQIISFFTYVILSPIALS